jgi:hypothetical protein
VPLIVKGMQFTPSSSNHFKKTDQVGMYAQVFVPQLSASGPPPPSLAASSAAPSAATAAPAKPADGSAPPSLSGKPAAPAAGATAAPAPAPATMVKVKYVIQDTKTNKVVYQTAPIDIMPFASAGNPVVALALKLPVDTLAPGDYTLRIQAGDNVGALTAVRAAAFSVE